MIFGAITQAAGSLWSMGAGLTEMQRATGERMRQLRLQHAQRLGQARAAAGASGVEYSSESIQRHLQTMEQEFLLQERRLEGAGDQAAMNMALSYGMQGVSDIGRGVAMQGALENWWRK